MSKGLEALDITKDQLDGLLPKGLTPCMKWNIETIEKELKALEIIKNKKVATFLLIWLMNKHTKKTALELYNRSCDEDRQLNEEDYDLLNEVLL